MKNLVYFCLLLAVFALVGCGGGGSDTPTTTATPTTTGTVAPTTTAAATTTTSGGTTTTATPTTTTTTTTAAPTYSGSGKVVFPGTTDGIRGGVTMTMVGPITKVTTSDVNTGAFAVSGLPAGTYTITYTKPTWITTTETANVSADISGLAIPLYPVSWEVLRVGGAGVYDDIISSEVKYPGLIIAVGSISGTSYYSTAEPPYTSWVNTAGYATTEPFVTVDDDVASIYLTGRQGSCFADGIYIYQITTEAILKASYWGDISWEVLTAADNKVWRTVDGGLTFRDLNPGISPLDIVTRNYGATVIVAGENGGAKSSINASDAIPTWSGLPGLTALAGSDDLATINTTGAIAVAGSTSGQIFYSSNTGANWQLDLEGLPYPLRASMVKNSRCFVAGGGGLIMKRK
jgi:hypothetical protein